MSLNTKEHSAFSSTVSALISIGTNAPKKSKNEVKNNAQSLSKTITADDFFFPKTTQEKSFVSDRLNQVLELFYHALELNKYELSIVVIDALNILSQTGHLFGRCVNHKGAVTYTLDFAVEMCNVAVENYADRKGANDAAGAQLSHSILLTLLSILASLNACDSAVMSIVKIGFRICLLYESKILRKDFESDTEMIFRIIDDLFQRLIPPQEDTTTLDTCEQTPTSSDQNENVLSNLLSFLCDQAEDEKKVAECKVSLQLLLYIFQQQYLLKHTDVSTQIVQMRVIPVLLSSAASTELRLFSIVMDLCFFVIRDYRALLKNEIGILLSNFLVPHLSTIHSRSTLQRTQSFSHPTITAMSSRRVAVCDLIQRIVTEDNRFVAEVFVNYDCDMHFTNIFENLFIALSRILQEQNEPILQMKAAKCIQTILVQLCALCDAPEKRERTHSRGSSVNIGHIVSDFEHVKRKKQLFTAGCSIFSLNPFSGMNYFIEHNFVKSDPKSVARFLKKAVLDKTAIGEYMGKKTDFSMEVMKEFVDDFDFPGKEVDEALREFLSTFRIPGESQIVDRYMLAFGAHYFSFLGKDGKKVEKKESDINGDENSQVGEIEHKETENNDAGENVSDKPSRCSFKDPDEVYMLSFGIVMLSTDLHNPSVKTKLTKADWFKIVNSDMKIDLSEEYLSGVYERISSRPFDLGDNNKNSKNSLAGLKSFVNIRNQMSDYSYQSLQLAENSLKLVKESKSKTNSPFVEIKQTESLTILFETIWAPTIAAFSFVLESSENLDLLKVIFSSLRSLLHLSCVLGHSISRSAVLLALEKFSNLTNMTVGFQPKHLIATQEIISIAKEEGELLDDAWIYIFRAISMLNNLAKSKVRTSISSSMSPNRSYSDVAFLPSDRNFSAQNSQTVEIDESYIDQIFSISANLSNQAIIPFIRSLCLISLAELRKNPAETFLLKKIVDVAHFNMNRVRFVWNEIWVMLEIHFVEAGSHEDISISMLTVDSLKQLALKFLEKEELSHYNFQMKFLKPYEVIFMSEQREEIKEMILQCVFRIAVLRAARIRSAWKTILSITSLAAEENASLAQLGFEVCSEIMKNSRTIIRRFPKEIIECFSSYALISNVDIQINIQSIERLQIINKMLCKIHLKMLYHSPDFVSTGETKENLFDKSNRKIIKENRRKQPKEHIDCENHIITSISPPPFEPRMEDNPKPKKQTKQQILAEVRFTEFPDDSETVNLFMLIMSKLCACIMHTNKNVRKKAMRTLSVLCNKTGTHLSSKKFNDLFIDCLLETVLKLDRCLHEVHAHDGLVPTFGAVLILLVDVFVGFHSKLSQLFELVVNVLTYYIVQAHALLSLHSSSAFALLVKFCKEFLTADEIRLLAEAFDVIYCNFSVFLDSVVLFPPEIANENQKNRTEMFQSFFFDQHNSFQPSTNKLPFDPKSYTLPDFSPHNIVEIEFNPKILKESVQQKIHSVSNVIQGISHLLMSNYKTLSEENFSLILEILLKFLSLLICANDNSTFRKKISGKSLSQHFTTLESKCALLFSNTLFLLLDPMLEKPLSCFAEKVLFQKSMAIFFVYASSVRDAEMVKIVVMNFLEKLLQLDDCFYYENLRYFYPLLTDFMLLELEISEIVQRHFARLECFLVQSV